MVFLGKVARFKDVGVFFRSARLYRRESLGSLVTLGCLLSLDSLFSTGGLLKEGSLVNSGCLRRRGALYFQGSLQRKWFVFELWLSDTSRFTPMLMVSSYQWGTSCKRVSWDSWFTFLRWMS